MATGDQEQVEVIARFGKCPWCGSNRRMMGELGEELKEQGLIGKDMEVGLHEVGGPLIDPRMQMLSQSLRPGMFALRDICIGCGRTITVKIEKKLTTIGMAPFGQQPPGVTPPAVGRG